MRIALLLTLLLLAGACSSDDGATDEASVSFGGIEDGAEVTSPVTVDFVAENFEIEEAGAISEGAGHMHVMVDTDCVAVGDVIPADENHIHYGDGSTSTELELEPGEHTLCLQAGDGAHTALDLTDEITITVS